MTNILNQLPSLKTEDMLNAFANQNQDNHMQIDRFNIDSPYIDTTYLQSINNKLNNKFSILHLNMRSLPKNYEPFMDTLNISQAKFSAIVLSETWLREDTKNNHVLKGYKSYHTVRAERRGGGISIYIRDDLNCSKIDDACFLEDYIESVGVRVDIGNNSINIVGLYRPPNGLGMSFINKINSILTTTLKDRQSIFAGDMNINLLKIKEINTKNLVNIMISNGFYSCISKATRINYPIENSTLLDQIWSNIKHEVSSGIILADITDHLPCFANFDINTNFIEHREIKYRIKSAQADIKLKQKMIETDFSFVREDTCLNQRFETLYNIIFHAYNTTHPIKTKNISCKRLERQWITPGILKSINQKHKLFKNAMKFLIPKILYTTYKNTLETTIKKAKDDYYNRKFDECKGNTKETWNILGKLLNRDSAKKNKTNLPTNLISNGNVISDKEEMANELNNFFSNIGRVTSDGIPPSAASYEDFLEHENEYFFSFSPINVRDVKDSIRSLPNKNCNLSTVPNRIFKLIMNSIAHPLCILFNDSFHRGLFPESQKIARICPIYKANDSTNPSNYRPISILPTISKIFERIVHKQLNSYLSEHNILSPYQFGFRPKSSTEDALISIVERLYTNINNKETSIALFLDLSKAFDTIDHAILIKKLESYGIRGFALSWFKSYLTNRCQYVKLDEKSSNMKQITHGVPQGSILGPLLFVLYINDFHKAHLSHYFQYADDTTIIISDKDTNTVQDRTNMELINIYNWLKANKLSLNLAKTSYIIVTNKKEPVKLNIKIDNYDIQCVEKAKVLGIIIDEKLTFKLHVESIIAKLSMFNYTLYHLKFLPKRILLNLYNSLAYPHILYCISLWGSTSDNVLNPLIVQHKKIIRNLSKSRQFREHTSPLYKALSLLKIPDICTLQLCLHIHKVFYKNAHPILAQLIEQNQPIDQRLFRNRYYYVHKSNFMLATPRRSLTFHGVDIWNKSNFSNKTISSLSRFRSHTKKTLMENY
jgi:hypothetical protein